MNMRRNFTFLLFHQAVSLLLIVTLFTSLCEQQCYSQVISGKNDYITLSIQNEQAAPSPSEVVKRYWKASADGKFSETRRYIDLCSMNPKDSAYKTRIDVLTKLTPKVIYNNRKVPDQKPGELVIGKIEEETLQGD